MKTLKKNYEFKKVLSRGKIARGTYLDLYYIPNKEQLIKQVEEVIRSMTEEKGTDG